MDEKELIEKLKDESTRNFTFYQLVQDYQERVYHHIRKMVIDHDDADDITQEVFIKVWKNIDSFREDSSLFTWIYRIATNEALNFLRKKKRRYFFSLQDMNTELANMIDNNKGFSGDEIEKKLQKALLQLPDKQRLVFNMKYYDDLKFSEISEITDTSVGALKASYHHAVKKIEEFVTMD